MTLKPIYCATCGGFTGDHAFVDSDKESPLGKHTFLEDCVKILRSKVEATAGLEYRVKLLELATNVVIEVIKGED